MNTTIRLGNERIRLLVQHVERREWVENRIVFGGKDEAVLEAHSLSYDGTHAVFFAEDEMIIRLYLNGVQRGPITPVPVPLELRTFPIERHAQRKPLLPGFEEEVRGMERRIYA